MPDRSRPHSSPRTRDAGSSGDREVSSEDGNGSEAGREPGEATDEPDGMPVAAHVDLSALRHNVRVLQERAAPSKLMAVVKADAYGHGAGRIAPVLRDEGVRAFAVARPAEGIRLREAGLKGTILVLGAPLPTQLGACAAHDLDVTVSSVDVARELAARPSDAAPLRVHVKVDTGMSRLGLQMDEVAAVVDRLRDAHGVDLAGLWTHFATADEPEHPMTGEQADRFAALLDRLGPGAPPVHTDNTGALLTIDGLGDYPGRQPGTLVRTGIALYGLAPTRSLSEGNGLDASLRPILTLTTRVTHVKTIDAGTTVSYGARWTASRPTRLATLGAGYGDGYPRLASGRAHVSVRGVQRPVVGTICMDMCMVDLGPPDSRLARRVEPGDPVTLFGPDAPTVYDVAEWAETIPYEICCRLSPRVPRRYVGA